MSFWQRLFGARRPQPAAPLSVVHDLIPGQLSVRVTRHDLELAGGGVIPCWTYVTQGLEAAGQREVVFSLRALPDEKAAPRDPLPFFQQLYNLARQGRTVGVGDYTCFRAPAGFLGKVGETGLAYIASVPLSGITAPPSALAAVLLTPEEAEVVPVIGPYRVTTLLGREARYYPCPPWSERGRPSVVSDADLGRSVLRSVPLAVYPGAAVRLDLTPSPHAQPDGMLPTEGAKVTLRLPLPQPDGFRDTIAKLPEEWSLALMTWPDPTATSRLVWKPGQSGPEMIGAEGGGQSATGGFVLLAAGQTMPTGARVVEDGIGLMLSPGSASQLRQALLDAGPLLLEGEKGLFTFSLEWAPSEASERPASAFEVHRTILYQPEEVMRERAVSIEAVSRYLRQVMDASEEYWSSMAPGEGRPVLLTFALRPGGQVRFWADCEPPLEPLLAGPWLDRLERIPPPEVRGGPVALGMEAMLWRAPGVSWQWPYMPAEWQQACAGRPLLIPEGVLEAVWPE
jgi:hypothetical protein